MRWLRWRRTFAATAVACSSLAGPARAQPADGAGSDALTAGRALFAEALADQSAGRVRAALEKFQQVQRVKDTAAIEYRLGTCQEGLGRSARAYKAYRAAIALGAKDPTTGDVVQAARERLEVLSRHVARLTLVLPAGAPADARVRVDDEALLPAELGEPVALEPGTHSVVADAPGYVPFQSQIALPDGGEASVAVALARAPAALPEPPKPVLEAPLRRGSTATAGWVFVGSGAVLLAGSIAALVMRESDIAALGGACPGGLCQPGSNEDNLNATRGRALAEGPLAAALGAGAVAATAFGAYLLLSNPASPGPAPQRAYLAPRVQVRGAGVTLEGTFR